VINSIAQSLVFKFSNDDDVPEILGGAVVSLNNKLLPSYNEFLELIFAASEDVLFSVWQTIGIPAFELEVSDGPGTCSRAGGGGSISIAFSENHNLRVGDYIEIPGSTGIMYVIQTGTSTGCQVRRITGLPSIQNKTWRRHRVKTKTYSPRIGIRNTSAGTNWIYYNGLPAGDATISATQRITFEGIGWDVLLKDAWRMWLGSIERYQRIRAYFKISQNDVVNFDCTIPVYVNALGGTYYLERINKYIDESESVEVELLRLGDLIDFEKINKL